MVLDRPRQCAPDWYAERLQLRWSAVVWFFGGMSLPERQEAEATGLRLVVQAGNPHMDYLFVLRARANPISVALVLALRRDVASRTVHLEKLDTDVPGNTAVVLTAVAGNVGLSCTVAAQMALTG